MTLAFCTYCSKNKRKSSSLLPAAERYLSRRIEYVHQLARDADAEFLILSGEYGLLLAGDKIPDYDHLLRPDEVEEMVQRVRIQIREKQINQIKFFTASSDDQPAVQSYWAVLEKAARAEDILLDRVTLKAPYLD